MCASDPVFTGERREATSAFQLESLFQFIKGSAITLDDEYGRPTSGALGCPLARVLLRVVTSFSLVVIVV